MSASQHYPRCLTAGEGAIVIELGERLDAELNARVRALDALLREHPFTGYLEAVPTYCSVTVFVDPAKVDYADAESQLLELAKRAAGRASPKGRLHRVPTVYDGPDLDSVAARLGVSRERVAELHAEPEYLVYLVGFTPGFAYMASTVAALNLPRRPSPRVRVPAGSVAVAMGQTGIYPSETPGGWHLLGRAEWRSLFQPALDPPSRFVAGDRVRFEPVDVLPEVELAPLPETESGGEPVFEVEESGLFTSVQDLGRSGYQRYGVPVAGAMDPFSFAEANRLVGNQPNAPAIEITLFGPSLKCSSATKVALVGGDLAPVVERYDLGDWRAPMGSTFFLRPGNRLRFDASRHLRGARCYLAIPGGVSVPPVLGSCSTYKTAGLGGHHGRAYQSGDRILRGATPCSAALLPRPLAKARQALPLLGPERHQRDEPVPIRIVWGPQSFDAEAKQGFVASIYRVSETSDRMGFRLEGPPVEHTGAKEILSDGMMLGAIQVPPNGHPIVMMADRATTGGYPKIATVILSDIPKMAQIPPGGAIRFQPVSRAEAQKLFCEHYRSE